MDFQAGYFLSRGEFYQEAKQGKQDETESNTESMDDDPRCSDGDTGG